ncbi:MAG TPA: glycosyltransferase, partial [Verrucomicrobiae bacterium]|nr:glycosyltransferase [Verrucomicrobiae bacterium]
MDVAIIICTYNRADNLRRTLEVMCALQVPADLQWEVVVVDNNSTDATRAVCVEVGGRLPLRYIFEPRQGKSHALN